MRNIIIVICLVVGGVIVYRRWIRVVDEKHDTNRDALLREAFVSLSQDLGVPEASLLRVTGVEKEHSQQSDQDKGLEVKAIFRKLPAQEVDAMIIASTRSDLSTQRREASFNKRLKWEDVPKTVREDFIRCGETDDVTEVSYDMTAFKEPRSSKDENAELLYNEISVRLAESFSVDKSDVLSVLMSDNSIACSPNSQRIKIECTVTKISPAKIELDVDGCFIPSDITGKSVKVALKLKRGWEDLPGDVRSEFIRRGEKQLRFEFGNSIDPNPS